MSFIAATAGGLLPQYSTDPLTPAAEDAWVLKSGGGAPIAVLSYTLLHFGLAMPSSSSSSEEISHTLLPYGITMPTSSGASTYQLSYRTKEGTTVRVALT